MSTAIIANSNSQDMNRLWPLSEHENTEGYGQ
jgi:hypothetical protein